jgi:indole-3-glycerol phosphate synthase
MPDILYRIAEYAKVRVAAAKRLVPPEQMKSAALSMDPLTGFPFEKALLSEDISFICECKRASPSKGLISFEFPYIKIAREYEKAGAACISVLTEPEWFLGSNNHLKEIAAAVSIPCLRKDFTVDEYMIYEAKVLGASAVLLICSILDTDTLSRYIKICDELGLSTLVEVHDKDEISSALKAGARIIGVNNRDLKDFSVNINNSRRLRRYVPDSVIFVSESGIKTPQDIDALRELNVNGVLIGETLMKAPDKKAAIDRLKGIQ